MYAKVENGILIFPPKNSGNMMNVDKNIQWLTENGYTDMSAEEIALIAIDLLCLLQIHIHMAYMGHVLLLLCTVAFPLGVNSL